jgi:hypothetical protein
MWGCGQCPHPHICRFNSFRVGIFSMLLVSPEGEVSHEHDETRVPAAVEGPRRQRFWASWLKPTPTLQLAVPSSPKQGDEKAPSPEKRTTYTDSSQGPRLLHHAPRATWSFRLPSHGVPRREAQAGRSMVAERMNPSGIAREFESEPLGSPPERPSTVCP